MKKEIGGEFHFPLLESFKRPLNSPDRFIPQKSRHFLTSSGRDSLKAIIKILKLCPCDEVLLPSYLCKEILTPFKEEKVGFSFYKVSSDLSVDIDDIKERITDKHRVLLIIHYFGFPQARIDEIKRLCQEHSLYLIEDISQSFFSQYNGKALGQFADIAFNSFRKFLPVFDGSLLYINNKELTGAFTWKCRSFGWVFYIFLRAISMSLKYVYIKMHFMLKSLYLKLFFYADKILNHYSKPAEISVFSKVLLRRLNFEYIILRRRQNYQYLLDHWHFNWIRPLFQNLPNEVCPLGFPVLLENRDYIRQELIKNRIYCPVHWHLPEAEIDKNKFNISWEISRNILTIPIDQRYEIDDMDYLIRKIKEIKQ